MRFTYNDARCISTGGNDKCVLVWDTDFGSGAEAGDNAGELEDEQNAPEEEFQDDDSQYIHRKTKKDKYDRPSQEMTKSGMEDPAEDGGMGFFQVEKVEGGDEFLAVKPWLGAIKEPAGWKKAPLNQNKPPTAELTLEYVHGYRCKYGFSFYPF